VEEEGKFAFGWQFIVEGEGRMSGPNSAGAGEGRAWLDRMEDLMGKMAGSRGKEELSLGCVAERGVSRAR
jgi:hypothetical protein